MDTKNTNANRTSVAVDPKVQMEALKAQQKALREQLKKTAEQAKAAKAPEKIETARKWIAIHLDRASRMEAKAKASRASATMLQERVAKLTASR